MIQEYIYYNHCQIGIHGMLILDTVFIVTYVSNSCGTIHFGTNNNTEFININTLTGMIQFDKIATCIQIVPILITYNWLDKNIESQTTNNHAPSKFNQHPYVTIYTNPSCVATNQPTALLNNYNNIINLLHSDDDDR